MSQPLSNDEFLSSLSALLTSHTPTSSSASKSTSIFLTQKPLFYTPDATSTSTSPETSSTPPLLLRATHGHSAASSKTKTATKSKLSTIVQPGDLESFFVKYAEVCKGGMGSLKKRDRKKARDKKKGKKGGAVAPAGK